MTASREPQQLPSAEPPTVRLRIVPALPPEVPQVRQKSTMRRIARKILGPNLLTKRD
ncbi:hypothetical protein ACTG9Q_26610 [Actinokineospora sp. 24-640]